MQSNKIEENIKEDQFRFKKSQRSEESNSVFKTYTGKKKLKKGGICTPVKSV